MQDTQTAALVTMGPDCTIRGIAQAHTALLQAHARDMLIVACDAVEQADVTFVQLMVSAHATRAARGQTLRLQAAAECVRSAFKRAAVDLPSGQED